MAELNVQPKKKNSWWPWLLLLLIGIAIAYFLLRDNNKVNEVADSAATAVDSTATAIGDGWDNLDFNAPAASYDEITDSDIEVRGNDEYAIYSVDETVLFDTDQNTIKGDATQKLSQIAQSVGKRFSGGEVRIFGHTDAQGSAGYNKELAEQRAESVKNWLVQNGNVTQDRISLHSVGESQPVASNATAEGRQHNRRVEIVVRRGNQAE